MTEAQQKAVARYAKKVAPLLGLTEWVVVVHRDPLAEESDLIGHCATVPGQKVAHLRLHDDFFACPPDDQRETLIHELLHIVHAATQHQVFDLLRDHMKKDAHKVFAALYNQSHEYAIDSLSVSMAPLFPLPRMPK